MSNRYYSKTEQQAAEREPFVRMAWGIGLFGLLVAVVAGGITLIVTEFAAGRQEFAGWATMLTMLSVSTIIYFLKETVHPSVEKNPDIYLR